MKKIYYKSEIEIPQLIKYLLEYFKKIDIENKIPKVIIKYSSGVIQISNGSFFDKIDNHLLLDLRITSQGISSSFYISGSNSPSRHKFWGGDIDMMEYGGEYQLLNTKKEVENWLWKVIREYGYSVWGNRGGYMSHWTKVARQKLKIKKNIITK